MIWGLIGSAVGIVVGLLVAPKSPDCAVTVYGPVGEWKAKSKIQGLALIGIRGQLIMSGGNFVIVVPCADEAKAREALAFIKT